MDIRRIRPSIYGVLVENGEVLVTETRGITASFAQFPGGGIKRGEAPADALAREMREETGLIVEAERVLYVSMQFHQSVMNADRQLLGIYWLVRRTGGELLSAGNGDDILRTFWCKVADLPALAFTSFDREALPVIIASLRPDKLP